MISEIDLLKEDIPRLERTFGKDNPFVEVLKAQLASLQSQTEQLPKKEPYRPGGCKFYKDSNPEKK